jgi:hypothetical protein
MATPDEGQDGDEEDGGKKKKNSYKHLIKGVPGELSASFLPRTKGHSHLSPRKTLNEERRLLDDNNASPPEAAYGYNAVRSKNTTRSVLGQLRGP